VQCATVRQSQLALSQHQTNWERAAEQMRTLRSKLGDAKATVFDELPPKPSRMRWSTYERIMERERQLTERWLSGFAPNLDRIKKRLNRRQAT
jgi:hypothetical protein